MGLVILRSIFILIASGIGVYILNIRQAGTVDATAQQYTLWTFYGILVSAITVVAFDMFLPKKRIIWISSVYFGLLIGLFFTAALYYALTPIFAMMEDPQTPISVMLVAGVSLCYICTSFLIQTKDDFRFIIPFVEFRRSVKGVRPLVLDTSAMVDGRIADIAEAGLLDNPVIVPKFVMEELQIIVDSGDKNRRARGRRGLDVLNKLQMSKIVELQIDGTDLPEYKGQPADLKLLTLTKYVEGKLVTNDYSLNKIAKVHQVDVINLNEIAIAMKPVYLPGEKLNIAVLKAGEGQTQGIGYLEDGTMVVVENGSSSIGERVVVTVTSVLQTSAGRLVFGQIDSPTKLRAVVK